MWLLTSAPALSEDAPPPPPPPPPSLCSQPVNSTDPLQVKQMEHMKERMGTLTFGDKVPYLLLPSTGRSFTPVLLLPALPPSQVYHLQNISDITDIIKIGNGISGEVYRLTHKASGITMAAKVSSGTGKAVVRGAE